MLFAGLLTLALFTAARAQTPNKAKLDKYFDRLTEKNKALTQDKFGIESAGIVFEFDTAKNEMIQKRGGRQRIFTKEN
jgi:hypothetical protein